MKATPEHGQRMDLGPSPRAVALIGDVRTFIRDHVIPAEAPFFDEVAKDGRWTLTARQLELLEQLKGQARSRGLWNFFLPEESGLSTVDYAYLAEEMGQCHLAAEVFNCNAPDSGNMEVLHRYGSAEQKATWLEPLLRGEFRSAYAMSEPGVASSDATNISTTAVLRDGEWIIDGEKSWISGAGDPRCRLLICMVKTDPDAPRHRQHSQILVPMDAPGVEVLRPLTVFGQDDAPHGHMHLRLSEVRVPEDHLLLGRGRGFEIAQGRLGPGRIHHCMRAIGMAERALRLMCRRAVERTAFGRPLAKLGGNYDRIAEARTRIEAGRLLTLKTAHIIDTQDVASAQPWISLVKAEIPRITLRVIDDAIQMHGGAGLCQDFPLAAMYAAARTLRLADGPDEVHRMVVARAELKPYLER